MKQQFKLVLALIVVFTFSSCEKENYDNYSDRPVIYKTGDDDDLEDPPILQGAIKNHPQEVPLNNGHVILHDDQNIILDSTITDSLGGYRFELEVNGTYYLKIYDDAGYHLKTSGDIVVNDSTYMVILY